MNVNKLKGKIIERELNVEMLASIIGIDRASLYRKLNNFDKVTIGEASKIKDALCISNEEACEIFFT